MSQQPKIFISYRRVDEPDFVGRMYDHFVCRYGEENVFMDLDIPDSVHFEKYIIKEVDESAVLVAVIGPQWLELLKEKSESDEEDYLVKEIERALDKGIMIAPICIKNAPVPKKDKLPSGIQKILDYQSSHVRSGSDFRDDMKKRIGFIDQRLEERGYKFGARTELDEILDKSLEKLRKDIFELLKAGNSGVLQIEEYLREFPSYFLNKASEKEESQGDILKTLTDKIIVFGIVFIQYNRHIQPELYQEFLRTLRLVFEGAYKRFPSPNSQYADKTLRIWTELLPKLYLLGAMLVQEDIYEWMSDFVKYPIPISWEHRPYYKEMFWMQYMQINIPEVDKTFLTRIINIIKENNYFYQQFSDDEEKIKDCICQFDFIQCVYDQINIGVDGHATVFPSFARYHRERTNPIIQEIIKTQFRDMLFGGQLDDKKLAEIIRKLAHRADNEFHTWHGRWNDSFPSEIMSFLEKNLSSDVFANSRYYL